MINLLFEYDNDRITTVNLLEKLKKMNDGSFDDSIKKIEEIMKNTKENGIVQYSKVREVLLNNETVIRLLKEAQPIDLVNTVIKELYSTSLIPVNQKTFNKMTKELIKKDNREGLWRLAFNYDFENMDYSKVIDYFVEVRDVWYLIETIGINIKQVDLDLLVDKIIAINDKDFISNILNDNFAQTIFNDEQLLKLKKDIE